MNIFFAGSIRGGRAHQPEYDRIVKILEQYGTVYSEHVHDETLSQYGETRLSAEEIFKREREAVGKSDVVVAEVTMPSLGVGSLISHATSLEKKVVALYRGEDTLKLSAMIKGDPKVEVHMYTSDEGVDRIFKKSFNA